MKYASTDAHRLSFVIPRSEGWSSFLEQVYFLATITIVLAF